jgi:hypothetical protein
MCTDLSQVGSNYLLNTLLRGSLPRPARQQIYNLFRRSHSAFADYELARIKTEQYLADRERIRAYIAAVGHWEDFLGHVWQANEFLTKALSPEAKRPMSQPRLRRVRYSCPCDGFWCVCIVVPCLG